MVERGEQNSLLSTNPDRGALVTNSPQKAPNIEIKIINMKKNAANEYDEHQRSHASSEWGPGFEDLPPAQK